MSKDEANASPKDAALRLALEYVELVPDDRYNAEHIDQDALITAIKAALEAKDEPVATIDSLEQEIYENTRQFVSLDVMEWMLQRYYTTPPQHTWVGLTAEEREQVQTESYGKVPHHVALIAAVEAKLKEKNT